MRFKINDLERILIDQIRGLITQSGIEGQELSKSMGLAAGQIANSFKGTAIAIGGFFIGAIKSAGSSLTELAMKITGTTSVLRNLELALSIQADAGSKFSSFLLGVSRLVPLVTGALAALSLVLGGALLVGLYQVTKQEDALAKQLALTGGSLGMNQASAIAYAESMNTAGVSTSKAIDVISAMAKEGGFARKEIDMIAVAATDMSKYFDIAVEDTVKAFAKLKDKPTEALLEIGKATGYVSEETMKLVMQLEQQGRKSEAAALAMKAYADSLIEQKNRVKEEYSDFAMFFMTLGSAISDFWNNKIKGSLYKASPSQVLTDQISNLKSEISGIESNLKSLPGFLTPDNTLLNQKKEELRILQSQLGAIVRVSGEQERIRIEQSRAAGDLEKTEALRIKSLTSVQTKQEEIKKLQNEITTNSARWGANSEHVLVRQNAIKNLEKEIADIQKRGGGNSQSAPDTSLIDKAVDAYRREFVAIEGLTDAQKTLLDIQTDSKWSSYTKTQQDYIIGVMNAVITSQKATKETKDLADARLLLDGITGKANGKGKDYADTLKKLSDIQAQFPELAPIVEEARSAFEAATPSAKKFQQVMADYAANIKSIEAERTSVKDQYGSDFKSEEQKAIAASTSKYNQELAKSDADYAAQLAKDVVGVEADKVAEVVQLAIRHRDTRQALAKEIHDRELYLLSDQYTQQKAIYDGMQQISKDFSNAVADQFIDFAKTGKSSFEELTNSFGNMVNNMIYDLIRLRIQKQVAGLLDFGIDMAMNYFNPVGSGADISGTNSYTGAQILARKADGGAYNSGVEMFAKGGTFTNSIVSSPTLFKFAKGTGLMGEAGPEAIMPLKRGSDGSLGVVNNSGSSNVEVVINNHSNAQATASETTDSRGNRRIEVTIGSMVASEIGRTGSETQKSLSSNFGLRQQLIRR